MLSLRPLGPFEMVKVRRQVQTKWSITEVLKGSGTTLIRNSFLFSSFVVYMDISRQYVELSPFWLGMWNRDRRRDAMLLITNCFLTFNFDFWLAGICANLAWLTVWPLDVVKSRMQSGNYEGKSFWQVLRDAQRAGHLYRGLIPGLTRSFIANGTSMEVYSLVEKELKRQWRSEEDII